MSFWAPLTMADAFPGADPWSEPDAATLVVIGRLRQDVTRGVDASVARGVAASSVFRRRRMRRRWPCASTRSPPASPLTTDAS